MSNEMKFAYALLIAFMLSFLTYYVYKHTSKTETYAEAQINKQKCLKHNLRPWWNPLGEYTVCFAKDDTGGAWDARDME